MPEGKASGMRGWVWQPIMTLFFLFHLLKFLILYPCLCVAADHDAASRERPMLRADVGHLAHLEANLQQQKILLNTKSAEYQIC